MLSLILLREARRPSATELGTANLAGFRIHQTSALQLPKPTQLLPLTRDH